MLMLAKQPGCLFLGQGVACDGVATFNDFEGVPMSQRIECPVAEELQLGMGIGLAMQGFLPVLIYPRMDFLLRAMDQLVNHLDKIEAMSCGQWNPKVIIRTKVGSKTPLDAGPQHTQDHTDVLRRMLTSVCVMRVVDLRIDHVLGVYKNALSVPESALVVESC